jgi:hypothetical protein
MASKGKRRPSARAARPANWFLDLGAERARELSRRAPVPWTPERISHYKRLKRLSEADYLTRAVLGEKDPITGKRSGGLRDYIKGFEASDGYDMRHPERLTARHAAEIRKYGSYLHTLQSQPYVKVAPRNAKEKRALQERTGQYLKRQKRFVYHVERPGSTKVTFKKGVLEERERVSGAEIVRQYYFFRDFNNGRQPKTFRAMVNITEKKMLPAMPDRYYTFWTDLHGAIGAPFPRKTLLRELQRYENQYGGHKGFAEGLLGFVFQGTADQADSEYVNRLHRKIRREQLNSEKNRLRQQRLRFLTQARRATRVESRRCDYIGRGGRCVLRLHHGGQHRFRGSKKK